MDDVVSQIVGSEKITNIFGYWPSFHDAIVLELNLLKREVIPEEGKWNFPLLTLTMHLWELTREVTPEGFLVLQHQTLVKLQFLNIHDFQMRGFDHNNSINQLVIENKPYPNGAPCFSVEMEGFTSCPQISATFTCEQIEVIEALPCTDQGKLIQ